MNLFFFGGILTRCRRLCKSLDVGDAADLTWKRLAGDSLEVNNEVFQKLTRPALEIVCSKGVLMHDSIEADESTIINYYGEAQVWHLCPGYVAARPGR